MKKETYGMLIDVISVIAGNLIIALGVNLFILPSDILSGGVAGIAVALQPVFHLPATLVINGLTIALFIVGAIVLGKQFARDYFKYHRLSFVYHGNA